MPVDSKRKHSLHCLSLRENEFICISSHYREKCDCSGCRRKTERWKLTTSELASSRWVTTWYNILDLNEQVYFWV